jgi:hypothetical protein
VHFGISESSYSGTTQRPHQTTSGYTYLSDGRSYHNSSVATYGASYTTGDIIGVAMDMDAGTLVFYKNGTSQGTAFTGLSGTFSPCFSDTGSTGGAIVNFGQRAFAYTAPTGYQPLTTALFDDPTIADGSTAMDVTLYDGNSSTQTITNGIDFSGKGGLCWIKSRNLGFDHYLFDTIRGANKTLRSNQPYAEGTTTNLLGSFNSDGFSLGNGSATNSDTGTFVAWSWQGDTAFSNSAGTNGATIASSGVANASAGFSIVTYTGNGTAGASVGHSLGVEPEFLVIKPRSTTGNWIVYSKELGNNKSLFLDLTLGSTTTTNFNNTTPSSTVFTVSSSGEVNGNGTTYVAYCFAPVEGYSAFGSYTGNNLTDGPFVYTGFRPKVIITKAYGTTSSWGIWDTERDTYNASDATLYPQSNGGEETTGAYPFDILSNGFKVRNTANFINATSGVIYMAWAENPFKYARAR